MDLLVYIMYGSAKSNSTPNKQAFTNMILFEFFELVKIKALRQNYFKCPLQLQLTLNLSWNFETECY